MRKLFRMIGKIIASILVLAFMVSALASILLLAFNTKLFDQDFYLEAFNEVEFFDQLPAIAATQIKFVMDNEGKSGQAGPPSYFQALSEKDWQIILEGLLPPEWLEDQILTVTGGLFESVEQGYGDLEIIISLTDLKERLSGEAGVEAIVQLLEDQPECSKDDLLEMTRVLQGKEKAGGDFLSCRPPDDFIKDYTPQLEVLLRRSLRDVPNELDLGSAILGSSKETSVRMFGTMVPGLAFAYWTRWLISISPLACLLLLIIIAFFGVYSYKGLSSWWGYPLAITGLLGLTISLLVSPVVNFTTNTFLRDREFLGISPVLIESASDLAVVIIRSLFAQVRNYSLIVLGMGLAVIITATVLGSPGKPKPESAQDKIDHKTDSGIPDTDPSSGDEHPQDLESDGKEDDSDENGSNQSSEEETAEEEPGNID